MVGYSYFEIKGAKQGRIQEQRALSHQTHCRAKRGKKERWIQEWRGNGNPDRRAWQPMVHVFPKN